MHICCVVSDSDFVVRLGFDILLFFPIHLGERAMQRRSIGREHQRLLIRRDCSHIPPKLIIDASQIIVNLRCQIGNLRGCHVRFTAEQHVRALKCGDCLVIPFRMKQRDAVISPHLHIFLLMRDEGFKFRGGTRKIAF